MIEIPGWQFAVEVHPPDWCFPAGKSWIAGWIRPEAGRVITDVRARIHHRVILGLSGLLHPAFVEKSREHEHPDPFGPGFSFLLTPQPGATLLRLELRDRSGRWTEFFRTKIFPAPDGPASPPAPSLIESLRRLVTVLLKQRLRNPLRSWSDLADNLVAALVAEPLNAHPSPPFIGALEEPRDIGRRRNGCIPVTGWLAHRTAKITRLLAVIDSLPVISLPHGLARQDIPGVFPALRDQADLAFVGEIALPVDFAAPVLLKLFAELDNGERHLAFTRRFTPQPHGDTGQMPSLVPGFTFACAVWALHRAAGRYALSRRGLIRAARSFWSSYQAMPAYRPARAWRENAWLRFPAGATRPADVSKTVATDGVPATTVIAPADDMLVRDAVQYFQIGREALALVQAACALAGCERVEAILDLPSGHGRVARWLRTAYPAAKLVVSDTQGSGVNFCIEHLGATGVQATVDGSHWGALTGPYDIIWCGSLLTHFGRDQWLAHLRRFAERLTPHGVLVFTTHGLLALDKLQTGEKDYGLPEAEVTRLCAYALAEGFGYADYPATPGYGISVSHPAWIRALISRETELQVLAINESAWDQHQDVVVCARHGSSTQPRVDLP
ncbi:MAG: class I SAM-dependent methyltransferase [Lacunisphaera sp.]|nr:class I SAM-dependent methyltransferase [Lacunisphaera sp.]